MSESSVESWGMIHMDLNKALDLAPCRGSDLRLGPEIYVSFCFLWIISVIMITYLNLNHDTYI